MKELHVEIDDYFIISPAVQLTGGEISQCLRDYIDKEQNNWPKLLPSVLMSLQRSPCKESTQFSPYRLLFGKVMNLPFDSQVILEETMGKDGNIILTSFFENWG